MDALIKLFSSLRVYWKIIIITLICNALIIYLICFLIIPEFKNYPLSKEIILSIGGTLCYSALFYFLSTALLIFWFPVHRLIDYNAQCIKRLNFITSTIALIFFTTYQLILMIFIEEYSFNIILALKEIALGVLFPTIMAPGELLRIKLAEIRNKKTPKN